VQGGAGPSGTRLARNPSRPTSGVVRRSGSCKISGSVSSADLVNVVDCYFDTVVLRGSGTQLWKIEYSSDRQVAAKTD
jgi:hypothetical protein